MVSLLSLEKFLCLTKPRATTAFEALRTALVAVISCELQDDSVLVYIHTAIYAAMYSKSVYQYVNIR